ncbi:helix-turn-helix transcriptional regulator [Phormidium sp. CLA17]|uniref:helix-turn-helix domain-containing protein n=1 Tax=Leptolyngbya sp. Cla-17 TaxID=2803751 RepID=UPI0014927256|nr:helix-turn-helix transcriptional regulator [Leptolyngbya sp. Cla-17]MBM0744238.1 helix-turn-helix transcriptional regulator [Leptolyngbya sp. Cla-17]
MPTIEQSDLIDLVRETRQRFALSQAEFVAKLGVSFQSVNRWGNGRTQPLSLALKQIESVLHQMGDRGQDLLVQHFST